MHRRTEGEPYSRPPEPIQTLRYMASILEDVFRVPTKSTTFFMDQKTGDITARIGRWHETWDEGKPFRRTQEFDQESEYVPVVERGFRRILTMLS